MVQKRERTAGLSHTRHLRADTGYHCRCQWYKACVADDRNLLVSLVAVSLPSIAVDM